MKRLGTRPVRCRSCSRRFYLVKGSSRGFIPAGISWSFALTSPAKRPTRRRLALKKSPSRQPIRRPIARPPVSRPPIARPPVSRLPLPRPALQVPRTAPVSPPVDFVAPEAAMLEAQLQPFTPQSSSNFEEVDKFAEAFARVPLGGRIALWMAGAYLSALPFDWIIGGYEIDYWWSKRASYALLALLFYFVSVVGGLIFSLIKTLARLSSRVKTKFSSTRSAAN